MENAATCPWHSLAPGTVRFCEEQLCTWITQPANTWSNLFYILVGILIIKSARHDERSHLQGIGWIAVLVGIGSFFFHASSTFIGEFCDLAAMFLFANYMLFFNAKRLWGWSLRSTALGYIFANIFSLGALLMVRPIGIAMFTAQVTIAMLLEIYIGLTTKNRDWSYVPLRNLCLTFSLAFLLWNLDYRGIWCDPHNHWLQGHALWHTLNSFCFWFAYRYYAQFFRKNNQF